MRGRPLVIAVHGSTHPGSAEVARGLASAASGRVDATVRVGTVDRGLRELTRYNAAVPTLAEAVADLIDPVVVPAFLASGYHVQVDVPEDAARATVTAHIGPLIDDAVADRVREAGGPGDGIVLAAAGSKRPEALAEVEDAGRRLGVLFGVPVAVGYLYGGGPSVEDALLVLRDQGRRDVIVATYVLAPGGYEARLDALGAVRVAGPIGVHEAVIEAIVSLYHDAHGREHEQSALSGVSDAPRLETGAESAQIVLAEPYLLGLQLRGRRVLVAGGGSVATRRIPALLRAGAHVHVIAPSVTPEIERLSLRQAQGTDRAAQAAPPAEPVEATLTWTPRLVTPDDVDGAWLVLSATDDPHANALVATASEARRIFCVRADAAEAGTARTPATGTSAGLTVGVLTTTGRQPARAARARDAALAALDAWQHRQGAPA